MLWAVCIFFFGVNLINTNIQAQNSNKTRGIAVGSPHHHGGNTRQRRQGKCGFGGKCDGVRFESTETHVRQRYDHGNFYSAAFARAPTRVADQPVFTIDVVKIGWEDVMFSGEDDTNIAHKPRRAAAPLWDALEKAAQDMDRALKVECIHVPKLIQMLVRERGYVPTDSDPTSLVRLLL